MQTSNTNMEIVTFGVGVTMLIVTVCGWQNLSMSLETRPATGSYRANSKPPA